MPIWDGTSRSSVNSSNSSILDADAGHLTNASLTFSQCFVASNVLAPSSKARSPWLSGTTKEEMPRAAALEQFHDV